MGANKENNTNGRLSIILSIFAIASFSFLLPAGMMHVDEAVGTIFLCLFILSIISEILGMVLGVRGKRESNNRLARVGFFWG